MSKYLERFEILGRTYGIEDYRDGQPSTVHFFADLARKEKWPRFKLWVNGGSFGGAKTLEEARQMVVDYAREDALDREHQARTEGKRCRKVLDTLKESAHLFRFEEK